MTKRLKPEMIIGEVRVGLKCDCGNETFEWVKFLDRPYRQCTSCYKLHNIQELLIKPTTEVK